MKQDCRLAHLRERQARDECGEGSNFRYLFESALTGTEMGV